MPKAGFKSITLSQYVYDRFYEVYQSNKEQLASKGVNSFAGYVTSMLEEMMQRDKTFAAHAPKFQELAVEGDRVILKDNIKNRIAEITIQNGELYCHLCEEKDCIHVGYVFSIPIVYEKLDSRGIKNPYFEK